jgi:CubicO group peptidase (beta-lactamase class C family)
MRHNSIERALIEKLQTAIQDVTPGVVVRAYHHGRMICDVQVGETYPIYDLASLTKVIFTQQKMMQAFDQGHWNLETKVKEILPDFAFEQIKVTELLTHTSGLDWWKPFYKDVPKDETWQSKRLWLFNEINKTELKQTGKAVYSDLGFMTLGFLLEAFYKKDLHQVWQDAQNDFYPTTSLDFHINNLPLNDVAEYAPTEECKYRHKVMRGEVHDENTWALGGISSHAGLFGSIDDVAAFGLNLRSQLHGIARYKIKQKTAQLFAARAIDQEVGDWAMGYMMPSAENASCGPHFSIHSIGHTGFTGTSTWYDPRQDLLVIALSNRVNYGRENRGYVHLRPKIHSWIYESINRVI